MKQVILMLLLLAPLFSSCANMGRVSTVIDPKGVSKEDLRNLHSVTTPVYRLRVATVKSLSRRQEDIVREVDHQFGDFRKCMHIKDKGKKAREYLIAVVNGTFECKYHGGRCNGEHDAKSRLIIVNYKAFNREGILPLLKHEWAHAYGILKSGDGNLDEVTHCTKY